MTCRVSMDELDHDREEEDLKRRKEAISDILEEKTHERYHELLEDHGLLWEALGPDGFVKPYLRGGMFSDAQNRNAEEMFNHAVANAVKAENWLELGMLLGEQAKKYLMGFAEDYIDDNWSDYE